MITSTISWGTQFADEFNEVLALMAFCTMPWRAYWRSRWIATSTHRSARLVWLSFCGNCDSAKAGLNSSCKKFGVNPAKQQRPGKFIVRALGRAFSAINQSDLSINKSVPFSSEGLINSDPLSVFFKLYIRFTNFLTTHIHTLNSKN